MNDGETSESGNLPAMSVSEVSGAVKRTLEQAFERVRVRGEVSRPKYHSSGHLYLTLKDENAVLDAVCWRGRVAQLPFRAEEGLDVIATGRISSYAGGGGSRYQLIVEDLQLAGEGAILKLLEERKRRLAAEGLFAAERKRPLPFLPQAVGVVTSPTGGVIRDILHRLEARFPRHVLVWPVKVQGEGAAEQVAAAIEGFNTLGGAAGPPRPDVLIVARGGGSLEDLWAFNEEIVVRAVTASAIPVISAIGHETDTTLIDLAADVRAPTPTAAAELAVPVRADLLAELTAIAARLTSAANRGLQSRAVELSGLARGLPDPWRLLELANQRLDERSERLDRALTVYLRHNRAALSDLWSRLPHPRQQIAYKTQEAKGVAERWSRAGPRAVAQQRKIYERLDGQRRLVAAMRQRLNEKQQALTAQTRLLESVSHERVLERGFVLVETEEGLVTRKAKVAPGAALTLRFADGALAARADGAVPPTDEPQGGAPAAKKQAKRKATPRSQDERQGRLL